MELIDPLVAEEHFNGGSDWEILAKEILRDVPTIDAVPVVRCSECDNHTNTDGYHYCKFWRMYCPDDSDFFCKAGKRKEPIHE